MSTKTFVNLPVKDVAKTVEFFTTLGFSFNQQFSDENTKCMVISDDAYAMLHAEPAFKSFTQQDITDTSKSREVIVGLSGRQLVAMHDIALPLFERVMARNVEREHFLERPAGPSEGNVREPMTDGTGVTGGWREGDPSPQGGPAGAVAGATA